MCQEGAAYAAALMRPSNIRMADQHNVSDVLKPHHADENTSFVPAMEFDTCDKLCDQSRTVHVRFVPAVSWDDAAVSSRSVVDDIDYRRNIRFGTTLDHRISVWSRRL
jgi:hypothetical protein